MSAYFRGKFKFVRSFTGDLLRISTIVSATDGMEWAQKPQLVRTYLVCA